MTSDATTRQSPQTQVLTEEDYDKNIGKATFC